MGAFAAERKEPIPAAVLDETKPSAHHEKAVFAGGCFWGTQAVFQRVKGVEKTTAGYAGGSAATATYDQVTTETTGHAESLEIVFDPAKISYGTLLRVFFSAAHDPTQLNRQGPDVGTSYRSAIFYTSEEQKKIAEAYIAQLDAAKVFPAKIVTQVVPLKGFYAGEVLPTEARQLYVDLSGATTLLWRQPGSAIIWSVPSPDGRNLAMLMYTTEANVYMVDGF